MIDAHCHIQSLISRLPHLTYESIASRASASGISRIVTCACSYTDWSNPPSLSIFSPQFGIHPWWASDPRPDSWLHDLRDLLVNKYPHSGVGEIGLDKNKSKTNPFPIQMEIFRAQLRLSIELNRPCTVHCVNAFGPLIEVFKQENVSVPIIMHSYSGSVDSIDEISRVASQVYFSVSGRCPRDAVIPSIPLDCLLIETDSPDQAMMGETDGKVPEKFSHNDPSQLLLVANRVAKATGISVSEIVRITSENAIKAFRLF